MLIRAPWDRFIWAEASSMNLMSKLTLLHLKSWVLVWLVALLTPGHAKTSDPATVMKRWPIAKGGEGKIVVVPAPMATEEGLAELGQRLQKTASLGEDAYVLIYSCPHAAGMRLRVPSNLRDLAHHDRHFVARYVRNRDTGVHEMELFPEGIDGPATLLRF